MKPSFLLSLLLGAMFLSAPAMAVTIYTGTLNGSQEVPPVGTPATGSITVTLNGDSLTVNEVFSGLTGGNSSAAHIHCCVAVGNNVGVAVGFPGFPTASSGTYSHVFNLLDPTIYTSAFLANFGGGTAAGAEAALIAGLNAGQAYANIHNATFPGGEIRANLVATPEPSTISMSLMSLLGITAMVRRRRA